MNQYGTHFRISLFGESHGILIGVVLDGIPAGIPLSEADFLPDLARRKSGARGTTPRKEEDLPEIVSGPLRRPYDRRSADDRLSQQQHPFERLLLLPRHSASGPLRLLLRPRSSIRSTISAAEATSPDGSPSVWLPPVW